MEYHEYYSDCGQRGFRDRVTIFRVLLRSWNYYIKYFNASTCLPSCFDMNNDSRCTVLRKSKLDSCCNCLFCNVETIKILKSDFGYSITQSSNQIIENS